MNEKLELQYRLADISNDNLEKAKDIKKEMMSEIASADLLSATLKTHMYVERELNLLYEYFFFESQTFNRLNFASKMKLIYDMGILSKEMFDVINMLNKIRNDFAHKMYFDKSNNSYKRLLDSLSNSLNQNHNIDIKMKEMVYGELSEERKYKILLAQIWIDVTIFCSSKERRKIEFGERLINEVKSDVEKIK
ncbi:hypothetical protein ACI2WT_11890 [Lysinibacillus fusiformis]